MYSSNPNPKRCIALVLSARLIYRTLTLSLTLSLTNSRDSSNPNSYSNPLPNPYPHSFYTPLPSQPPPPLQVEVDDLVPKAESSSQNIQSNGARPVNGGEVAGVVSYGGLGWDEGGNKWHFVLMQSTCLTPNNTPPPPRLSAWWPSSRSCSPDLRTGTPSSPPR